MVLLRTYENIASSERTKKVLTFFITSLIAISLLILSCYIKNLFSEKLKHLGESFYYTYYNSEGNQITWYLESYGDASYYYEAFLENFRYKGWNPYKRYIGSKLDYYLYGPIFIYSKYLTSLIIGLFNPDLTQTELVKQSIKWSAITIDSLSVMMMYIVIINLKFLNKNQILKHIIGIFGAFAYMLAPINLYYSDTLYLNGPLMTFFALIGLTFFLREKYRLSGVFLAFSFLSKQLSLFLVIQFFLLLWKSKGLKTAFKNFLNPFLLTSFIISIPWIFITPILYIGRIFAAGHPQFYLNEEASVAQSLANSITSLGCDFCAQIYWYFNFVMLPFILFYGGSLLLAHFNAEDIMKKEENIILYTNWSVLMLHVFISRGIYKYYNTYINAFLILSVITLSFKLKKKIEEKNLIKTTFRNIIGWILFGIFLIGLFILLYGENILLMKIQRERHPLLLLVILTIFSLFNPKKQYASLFKKKQYIVLKSDVKDFFVYFYMSVKSKITKIRVKIKDKDA